MSALISVLCDIFTTPELVVVEFTDPPLTLAPELDLADTAATVFPTLDFPSVSVLVFPSVVGRAAENALPVPHPPLVENCELFVSTPMDGLVVDVIRLLPAP